jgi:uncharacterized membrane protein
MGRGVMGWSYHQDMCRAMSRKVEGGEKMDAKSIFESKTFWFNVLALIVMIANYFGFGSFEIDPDTQAAFVGIVAILNLILRTITTKSIKF